MVLAGLNAEQKATICKAVTFGLWLELLLCIIASMSMGTHCKQMWVTMAVFVGIRLLCAPALLCPCGRALDEFGKATFFFMCIWPFLFYFIFMGNAHVNVCKLVEEEIEIKSLTQETTTVSEQKIACDEPSWLWLPFDHDLSDFTPLIIQFGVPFLFASIFVSSANWFGADIRKSKTAFQLALLDYVDIANFATIAFTLTGWLKFQQNPHWFRAFVVMVVVAFVAAIAEVFAGLCQGLTRRVREDIGVPRVFQRLQAEQGFAILSLLMIDLPLGYSRGYFLWSGLDIDYLFLGKNILCATYQAAVLCGCTKVQAYLARLVDMVPGADQVDAVQEGFEKKVLERRLAKEHARLLDAKSELTSQDIQRRKQEAVDANQTQEIRHQLQMKMEQALFLVRVVDEIMVSKEMQYPYTYDALLEHVSTAFTSFDENANGALSMNEINEKAFSFVGREEHAVDFIAFMQLSLEKEKAKACKASDEVPIDQVANYFMKWRTHMDAADDDDDGADDEDGGSSG